MRKSKTLARIGKIVVIIALAFADGLSAPAVASAKNQAMDRLLELRDIPADYADRMAAILADRSNDELSSATLRRSTSAFMPDACPPLEGIIRTRRLRGRFARPFPTPSRRRTTSSAARRFSPSRNSRASIPKSQPPPSVGARPRCSRTRTPTSRRASPRRRSVAIWACERRYPDSAHSQPTAVRRCLSGLPPYTPFPFSLRPTRDSPRPSSATCSAGFRLPSCSRRGCCGRRPLASCACPARGRARG